MKLIYLFGILEKSPVKRKSLFGNRVKKQSEATMASVAGVGESTLRELTHPSFNEAMKSHNSVTFKLVRTGEYII